jgi:hypothetical protein
LLKFDNFAEDKTYTTGKVSENLTSRTRFKSSAGVEPLNKRLNKGQRVLGGGNITFNPKDPRVSRVTHLTSPLCDPLETLLSTLDKVGFRVKVCGIGNWVARVLGFMIYYIGFRLYGRG